MNKAKNRYQKGAALIVSLVILLLMTLIGIFAMRTSIMEEKMATNQRDRQLAYQAAEVALRDAELFIQRLNIQPIATVAGTDNNIRSYNSLDPDPDNANPWWVERDATWWNDNNNTVASFLPGNVATAPRYVIEEIQFDKDEKSLGTGEAFDGKHHYRITARGTGGSDLARVLLQTTVVKEY